MMLKTALDPIRRRNKTAAGLAAAALAVLLAAPLAGPVRAAEEQSLVIARNMDINSLDPARAFCDTCQIYVSSVYDTLVSLGMDNRSINPGLASSWESNENQTRFTFQLNPEAVFADGSPVEASDVKWSLPRLKNMQAGPSFLMNGVESIETPDAHTVVFNLSAPNSAFIGILTAPYTGIVNSDVAKQHGAKAGAEAPSTDTAQRWFLSHSAGSGPYVLEEYSPSNTLRLSANPNYWREGPPIEEVIFRHVENAVSQGQMLESGAVDIAMQIDPITAKRIDSEEVVTRTVPSFNFVYIALSPGDPGAGASGVALTDKVRKAIGYALNYEGIIDVTLGGAGRLQPAPIPNGFPGTEGLPKPEYDLERAKQLLAEAGLSEGFTLTAGYPNLNAYGVNFSLMMQKIKQSLAKAGINLELQPMTFSVFLDRISGDGLPVSALYYAPDYYGSAQYVQYFAMTPETAWAHRAGVTDNPDVLNERESKLFDKALAASGEKRSELYHELALELIEDRIIIPIVSPNLVLAYRDDVKGVRYSACCNLPLDEISFE